ncbi:MAG: DUF3300 domain-containing protein [Planctomycetia bacterium]|nr:DUF3300 domain-containing protein [Planctomycetia bacterium]
MLKQFSWAAALLLVPMQAAIVRSAEPARSPAPEQLSATALEALVSGIALYPDPLVEQILLASRNPLALHQAAEALNGTLPPDVAALAAKQSTESVDYLKQYPDVLLQLNAQLALTSRLGIAYRVQAEDVWIAIAAVRAAYETALAAQAASEETTFSSGGSTGAYPVYGGWVARNLLAAGAVHELNEYRFDRYPNATTTNVTGPNGQSAVVTGGAVSGATTIGDTTYAGAAGAGTVTGPQGQSVTAAGAAHGSVTQTENGVQTQSQATGAYSASTGASGQGTHSGSSTATQNADGSTSWTHASSNTGSGTNGTGNVTHTGSGTATGDGSGSYHGETTVNANGNSVSTETNAGNGQASTTVTNNNSGASNTYTAGDGQIENAPSTKGSSSKQSGQPGSRDWSQMNRDQISQASQAMKQSWGQLGSQLQSRAGAQGASVRTQKSGATSKQLTNGAASGNRGSKASAIQRPTQTKPTRSNGQRGGGGGGGRGGRGGRR